MKSFSTISEQIDLLQSRGVLISDIEKSKQYLLTNNYYNVINGYSKFFQNKHNEYISGTSFDEITQVYFYDTEIKFILFKAIIEAERHFKSVFAYRFAEQYQSLNFAYLRTSSYKEESLLQVSKSISILTRILNDKKKAKQANSIKHYLNNHQDVPIWVIIDQLTFGNVIHIYNHVSYSLKNSIAKDLTSFLSDNVLQLSKPFTVETLESFLKNMVEIRNVCAHNNRLLGYTCRENIKYLDEIHTPYKIKKNDSRQNVFNVMISLQSLLSKTQYAQLHNTILKRTRNLDKKLTTISVNEITKELGIPTNWQTSTEKLPQ